MASISRQPNGRRTIQFMGLSGKRHSIRLGKVPQRTAETIKIRIEHLVAAAIGRHAVDDETMRWVAGLDNQLADRLASLGLIPQRHRATLRAFLDDFIASRIDVKSSTQTVYGHTRRNLIDFFGGDKPLRDISRGDADAWRLDLIRQGLAESTTIRRRSGIAKQFFHAAVRKRLIATNPFDHLKASVLANRSRDYFIAREEAEKVLESCPDAQWRLLFALSRYGGLRCPSEHLRLEWSDVDWATGRITVHSPKTEHHVDGESRVIPLFPELRPFLEEVWDQAETGTKYVITRYRSTNANLRTQLCKIIRRAGLIPWPKLFQNLRATRQTELAEDYPAHVVCAWIGNSRVVAEKHYLQVTDDHYASALQKAVQQPAAGACKEPQQEGAGCRKPLILQGDAVSCDLVYKCIVGDTGLEPVTPSLSML
jgi:integrase